MSQQKKGFTVALFFAVSVLPINNLLASTVNFQYDARGRLIEVKESNSKLITYEYDDAGNRLSSANAAISTPTPTPPQLEPAITSYSIPSSVRLGSSFTVSWVSTNTSYCAVSMFGDSSSHPREATSGSVSLRIYENTSIVIKCHGSNDSAAVGKLVKISFSGGPGGFN